MFLKSPIVDHFPSVAIVSRRLGDAERDVELLRGLLHLAKKAEFYRECDRRALAASDHKRKGETERNAEER